MTVTAVEPEKLAFHYQDHHIRALLISGSPWFVAGDVAKVLGYRAANDLTRRLEEDEKGTRVVRTPGGDQSVSMINEAGLYAAILNSRVEEARPFKRWVTHEVLPSIRQTGSYARPKELTRLELIELARESELARLVAEEENTRLNKTVRSLSPRAHAWDGIVSDDGRDYTVREAAKLLNRAGVDTGPTRLHKYLESLWIFGSARNWQPYQRVIEQGYMNMKLTQRKVDDKTRTEKQVRITKKGLEKLLDLMSE